MTPSETIVNLKHHPEALGQYVELRNRFCNLLMTHEVSLVETSRWIESEGVEVHALVDGGDIAGAVTLYLDRGGEIAVFARESGRGIGGRLIAKIEGVARDRGLVRVWAWVLETNEIALRLFLKCGYADTGRTLRRMNGAEYGGRFLRKVLE